MPKKRIDSIDKALLALNRLEHAKGMQRDFDVNYAQSIKNLSDTVFGFLVTSQIIRLESPLLGKLSLILGNTKDSEASPEDNFFKLLVETFKDVIPRARTYTNTCFIGQSPEKVPESAWLSAKVSPNRVSTKLSFHKGGVTLAKRFLELSFDDVNPISTLVNFFEEEKINCAGNSVENFLRSLVELIRCFQDSMPSDRDRAIQGLGRRFSLGGGSSPEGSGVKRREAAGQVQVSTVKGGGSSPEGSGVKRRKTASQEARVSTVEDAAPDEHFPAESFSTPKNNAGYSCG